MSDPLLIALADAYFDDELDATGAASLDAALASDASFRQWFAEQCRREVALRAVLVREEQARHAVSGPYPILGPGTTTIQRHADSSSRWRRTGRSRPRRRMTSRSPQASAPVMAAAAVFALGIIVWMLSRPGVPVDRTVAVVTALAASDPVASWQVGDRLAPGQRLIPAAGMTLRFPAASAQVDLAAGTQGEIRSDGLHVAQGAVQVALPPQRHQNVFRISTPQAQVEVIGTDFSVAVQRQRTTLAVRTGTVAWITGDGRRPVRAGETVQWPPEAVITPVSEPVAPVSALQPATSTEGVTGFVLCDATTGQAKTTLREGARIPLGLLDGSFAAIRAEVTARVQAVEITVDGPTQAQKRTRVEAIPPFIYPGDTDGVMEARWLLQAGVYRVQAQAYADTTGRESLGIPLTLTFTVIDDE